MTKYIEVSGQEELERLVGALMRDYQSNDEYVADSIEGGFGFGDFFDYVLPERTNYPPSVRKIIEANKNAVIIDLEVCRKPLNNTIRQFANLIALGTLNRDVAYDDIFHLYLIIYLDNGKVYLLEKNHVIKMVPYSGGPCGEHVNLLQGDLTLGTFLKNAEDIMGPGYFKYNFESNNCQSFVNGILSANNLLTSELANYILQDPRKILKDSPGISKDIFNILTGIASRADRLIYGQNLMKRHKKYFKKKVKGKALVRPKKARKNTDVQSVFFKTKYGWTEAKAEDWIKEHGFKPIKEVDKHLKGELRYRMRDPEEFNTFRTHILPDSGIDLVFGFKD